MLKKIKNDLLRMKYAIIVLIIYCIFAQINFDTVCPFKAITGIPCPACGLTHATIYMFVGKWKEAINSNPTVFLWWTFIIMFIIDRYFYKLKFKVFPTVAIVVGIITLLWYSINIVTYLT